jgi:hypothetical protein
MCAFANDFEKVMERMHQANLCADVGLSIDVEHDDMLTLCSPRTRASEMHSRRLPIFRYI